MTMSNIDANSKRWSLLIIYLVGGLIMVTPLFSHAQESQESDYLKLKERYFAAEIESGFIMNDAAHSIGVEMGFVRNENIHTGLSLHFMLTEAKKNLPVGSEELSELNLLGLNFQYRNHLARKAGYLAAFSANIGTATYNRLLPENVITSSGFTLAGKPKVGFFYQFNRSTRMYAAIKYLHGYIFQGQKSYEGLPMFSIGVRISEVGF